MPLTLLPATAHAAPGVFVSPAWDAFRVRAHPPLTQDPFKLPLEDEEAGPKRLRGCNGTPTKVPLSLPKRLQMRLEQEGVAYTPADQAAVVQRPRKFRVVPPPPAPLGQRLVQRLPTPPTLEELKARLAAARERVSYQLYEMGRFLLEASARKLRSTLTPPTNGFHATIDNDASGTSETSAAAALKVDNVAAVGATVPKSPVGPTPAVSPTTGAIRKPKPKVAKAKAKAKPKPQPLAVPLPILAARLPIAPPKPLDETVDPQTGIYNRFLEVLRGPAPTARAPKKAGPANRVVVHKPDAEDRQFPSPPIFAEPAARKKARKSIMLKWLTDTDMWKLENFYITWDCTACQRTFIDQEALQKHKLDCSGELLSTTASGPLECQYCHREFASEAVLGSHRQHTHSDRKEVKQEIQNEKLRGDVAKIQKWVDECDIDCTRVESCMNTLHQLNDTLIMMMVYLASRDNATRQLAGREMMVMVDIAVKASALGCSTSAVSVADITSANPTVVAGLFHAIAHLEGYGLLPSSLRQQVDDTRRKRNIVFHTLGVVLDEEGLEKQSSLAVNVLRWSQLLMDRTLNVVQARDPCMPPKPKPEPVILRIDPSAPRLPNGALASGPIPYVPPGVSHMGNQSGIPAWKYTAPEIPILNRANVLLGEAPGLKNAARAGAF